MIYAPKRFCFIHIPRTSGMGITQSLASPLIPVADVSIITSISDRGLTRHARAVNLSKLIEDWNDIWKWTVLRDPIECIESWWRLVQRDAGHEQLPSEWRKHVLWATQIGFPSYVRRHFDFLQRGRFQGFYGHWCGNAGVDVIRFHELHQRWPEICRRCGLPEAVPLQHANAGHPSPVTWPKQLRRDVEQWCRNDFALLEQTNSMES